jgi:hypothetical protein
MNWSEISPPPALHDIECLLTEPLSGPDRFARQVQDIVIERVLKARMISF